MREKKRAVSQGTLRPTTAKVREQLMAILSDELEGARVLDLFAGSGSLGLAALDEGAGSVVFVEWDQRSLKVLYEEVAGRGRIVKGRLPAALARLEGPFDVVLADPPYGSADGPATLAALSPLLKPGGVAVFEHHHKDPYPAEVADLRLDRRERHGETAVSFWRRLEDAAEGEDSPGIPQEV